MERPSLLPDDDPLHRVDRDEVAEWTSEGVAATDDPEVIRQWAARHHAEPATGEATPSGPATVNVRDGGAGIRFNFPAASAYRPITWDEWLEHFTQHDLVFVYEKDVPGQSPKARYRLVPRNRLEREARR
jgi:hypothetical protein